MDNVPRPIRHASEFWDHYGVAVGSEPEGGDLIFFTRRGNFPTHVGIVRDGESYVHAPGRDNTRVVVEGIKTEKVSPPRSGRLLYPVNPIGYKAPTQPLLTPTGRYHQELI